MSKKVTNTLEAGRHWITRWLLLRCEDCGGTPPTHEEHFMLWQKLERTDVQRLVVSATATSVAQANSVALRVLLLNQQRATVATTGTVHTAPFLRSTDTRSRRDHPEPANTCPAVELDHGMDTKRSGDDLRGDDSSDAGGTYDVRWSRRRAEPRCPSSLGMATDLTTQGKPNPLSCSARKCNARNDDEKALKYVCERCSCSTFHRVDPPNAERPSLERWWTRASVSG